MPPLMPPLMRWTGSRPLAAAAAVVVVASLVACGGDGSISPSSATPSDLHGWWRNVDDSGLVRIFAFVAAEEALWTLGVSGDEVGGDVSAVYQATRPGDTPTLLQLAGYDVAGGKLEQTVLGDANAPVGTQYETTIYAIAPKKTLTLESDSAASGRRTYDWYPRCPVDPPTGWAGFAGLDCGTYFATGAALAIDRRGGIHAVVGLANAQDNGLCAPVPEYSDLGDGCEPTRSVLPNFTHASVAIDDDTDTVHVFYAERFLSGANTSGGVSHRWRGLRETEWHEEQISPGPRTVNGVRFILTPGGGAVGFVTQTDGTLERFTLADGTWTTDTPTHGDGTPLAGWPVGLTLDGDGHAVVGLSTLAGGIYREAGDGTFTTLPLPEYAQLYGDGLSVDARGRVHALLAVPLDGETPQQKKPRYGIFDGEAWSFVELGPIGVAFLLPRAEAPWGVLHQVPTGEAMDGFALTELDDTAVLRSERLGLHGDSSSNPALNEPFGNPAATEGPDGTIAATWNGAGIAFRPSDPLFPRQVASFTVTLGGDGAGRVRSIDGAIDCPGSCSADVPLGTRVGLVVTPDDGALSAPVGTPGPGDVRWVDVVEVEQTQAIDFVNPTVRRVVPLSDGTTDVGVHQFDAKGDRAAALVTTPDGQLVIDGQASTLSDSGPAVAAVQLDADNRATATLLGGEPQAIRLADGGGVWALLSVQGPGEVGSQSVGEANRVSVVRAHVAADGALTDVSVVVSVPFGAQLVGYALDGTGAGAVVGTSSANVLDVPGVTTRSALLTFAADGASAPVDLPFADRLRLQDVRLDARQGRVALYTHGRFALYADGAEVMASQIGGGALAVTMSDDGVWLVAETGAGGGFDPDGDGTPVEIIGTQHWAWVHLDGDGAVLDAGAIAQSGGLQGTIVFITPFGGGQADFVAQTPNGFNIGRVDDPTTVETIGGTGSPSNPGARPVTARGDAGAVWVLAWQPQPVDYEIVRVDHGGPLLLQLAPR